MKLRRVIKLAYLETAPIANLSREALDGKMQRSGFQSLAVKNELELIL
jgi:hypothetical protein